MAVVPPGNAFGVIQPQQFTPRDPIQNAPELAIRIGTDVRRRRLALRTAFQIEAQPVTADTSDTPFGRLHPASLAKGAVVHVGAIGEVPDLIGWMTGQHVTMPTIMAPRQEPRFGQQSAPPLPDDSALG